MRRTLYFGDKFWQKLKEKSKEKEMTMSEYIRYILRKYWGE